MGSHSHIAVIIIYQCREGWLIPQSKPEVRCIAHDFLSRHYIKIINHTHYIDFQHHTRDYLGVIQSQYIQKHPLVKFEKPESVSQSDFINPELKQLEIHHFSHHKTAALSLDGDNLCFTDKVVLRLHESEKEYKISVDQQESVSSRSIQKHQVSLDVPRKLANSPDSNDYQETVETADICLYTHFGEFYFKDVEVKHKV